MIKAQNCKAWHNTPSVPLTVSSEAEKLDWEASLNDVGHPRDPIEFAAHLAMQAVRTKSRLDGEKDWVRQVQSKQDRREARGANHYLGPLKPIEGEDSNDEAREEEDELPVVAHAYAVGDPRAVVVEAGHTALADAAVLAS